MDYFDDGFDAVTSDIEGMYLKSSPVSYTHLDTVISERIAYHDVARDLLTEFHPWMDCEYFYADKKLLRIAQDYRKTAKSPILFGTMVSGEQFVTDDNRARCV